MFIMYSLKVPLLVFREAVHDLSKKPVNAAFVALSGDSTSAAHAARFPV